MAAVTGSTEPGTVSVVLAQTAAVRAASGAEGVELVVIDPAGAGGWAAARNAGAAKARGQILVFLGPDAVPQGAWIAGIRAAFVDDVGAAGLAPSLAGLPATALSFDAHPVVLDRPRPAVASDVLFAPSDAIVVTAE